ncbi:MAG: hypothetical protein VKJ86_00190 [Synechococcus sp.]|nr:hypothetical protein [Synechococcus sp.]
MGFPDSLDYLFTLEMFENINSLGGGRYAGLVKVLVIGKNLKRPSWKTGLKTNLLVSAPSSGEAPVGLAQGYPMLRNILSKKLSVHLGFLELDHIQPWRFRTMLPENFRRRLLYPTEPQPQ